MPWVVERLRFGRGYRWSCILCPHDGWHRVLSVESDAVAEATRHNAEWH